MGLKYYMFKPFWYFKICQPMSIWQYGYY